MCITLLLSNYEVNTLYSRRDLNPAGDGPSVGENEPASDQSTTNAKTSLVLCLLQSLLRGF